MDNSFLFKADQSPVLNQPQSFHSSNLAKESPQQQFNESRLDDGQLHQQPSMMANVTRQFDQNNFFPPSQSTTAYTSPDTSFLFPPFQDGIPGVEALERPNSAPIGSQQFQNGNNGYFNGSNNNPYFDSMTPPSMTAPSSPTMHHTRPLTGAQKAALMTVTDMSTFEEVTNNKQNQNMQQGQTHRMISSEMRRVMHIQSEQRRRAMIKGGFDELKAEIPGCAEMKKMSKSAILSKAIEFLRRIKQERELLYIEMDRLRAVANRNGTFAP